jgi:hypothetical protein
MSTFATDQEAAAYHMLHQVLQNHIVLHALPWQVTCRSGTLLLIEWCVPFCRAGLDPTIWGTDTVCRLKEAVRARQSHPTYPAALLAAEDDNIAYDDPRAVTLFKVLHQALVDAAQEQRIDTWGGFRVALTLTADLLSVHFSVYEDNPLDPIDKLIEQTLGPMLITALKSVVSRGGSMLS